MFGINTEQKLTPIFALLILIYPWTSSATLRPPRGLEKIIELYQTKCDQEKTDCFLNECDLQIKNCHPDKVLLFRGEGTYSTSPIMSDLNKTCLRKSPFCTPAEYPKIMANLRWAIQQMQPTSKIPGENKEVALINKNGNWKWYYVYDENGEVALKRPFSIKQKNLSSSLSTMQIIFLTHQNGAKIHYQQSDGKLVPIDPFVSFSTNPQVALQFASEHNSFLKVEESDIAKHAAVILISVPAESITADCQRFPAGEGIFLDPKNCGRFNSFRESEYPAFYSVPENLILKRFKIETQT